MAITTVHPLTATYYPMLGDALLTGDADGGYPLLGMLDAMLLPLQPVWDICADSVDGLPGWETLLDPQRIPYRLLPWLAQLVGVGLDAGLSEVSNRARVGGLVQWHRGQADVVRAAALEHLPTTATVDYVERDPDPFTLHVRVYVGQSTPAQRVAARAAVEAALPAHLSLLWEERAGQAYADVTRTSATHAAETATYPTYGAETSHVPGP